MNPDVNPGAEFDLQAWLDQLGLAAYAQTFVDNHVDAELLPQLTGDDLREMGISSVGHRRRLLDAAAPLRQAPPAPQAPVAAVAPSPMQRPPAAAAARSAPSVQRRQITVVFCDLVGSTALSARVDPEDLRDYLNHFRNLLARLVQQHSGWIAQYLGDGVLAYFGYPEAHEHDAEQAVTAALAIVEGLVTLPAMVGAADYVPQVRIGVATGMTVVGATLAADDSSEHSAVGQTPNLAARAQSMAAPDTVVVTAETRQLIGGLFECHELGRFELKGFTDPVPLWQVTRESPLASRFDALRASSQHALVGRGDEAARILQRLAEARSGRGRLVVITGEGGIGKSRLVGHVVQVAQLASGPRLIFQCSPYHVSTPLHSVRYYLERASGIGAADSAQQAADKLGTLLSNVGTELTSAATAATATTAAKVPPRALLAELLRLKRTSDSVLNTLSSTELRRLTMRLLASELEAAARRAPLLIIEDLQWIDPSSAELFATLLARLATLPVLVIATMRPGPLPAWMAEGRGEVVALDRLDAASTRALARAVAAPQVLSAAVEDAVVARSDGVPLFAEELTRACLQSVATAGAVAASPLTESTDASAPIPSTLVESLLARLDRYAHGRELAPIAAVLGREISVELLIAVSVGATTLDRAGVQRGIRELLDAGVFVAGHSRFGEAIAFRHMLVREAAYQLLLRRERQRLHAHAAQTIESNFPQLAEALPQSVARHLTEAGEDERAALWWERAGADANQRSAYQEAMAFFRRALDLTDKRAPSAARDLREFELRRSLIKPLIAATGFQTAEVGAEISRSISLAECLGPQVSLVATLALKWMWHGPAGELGLRAALTQRMHEVATGGSEVDKLWAYRFRGTSRVFSGRFKEAQADYEAFLALFDEARHGQALADVGPTSHHLMVLVGMAEVATFFKQPEQARLWRERSLAVARASGRLHDLSQVLMFAGCLLSMVVGDADGLSAYAQELLELTHADEDRPLWRGHAELFLGLAMVLRGSDPEQGFVMAASGIRQMQTQAAFYHFWYIPHADACCRAGRLAEAQASLDLALPMLAIGQGWMEAERLRVQGQLRQRRGEPLSTVRQDLEAGLRVARQQEAPLFIERAEQALLSLGVSAASR